jgi:hypothetical protein
MPGTGVWNGPSGTTGKRSRIGARRRGLSIGTGRGSGMWARAQAAEVEANYPPSPTELSYPPLPMPDKVRGFRPPCRRVLRR